MKLYIFLFIFFFFKKVLSEEPEIEYIKDKNIENNTEPVEDLEAQGKQFEKDIEELDLDGFEDDIEAIDELILKDDIFYITQIYVYVRIDGEYSKYKKNSVLLDLGSRYMTELSNAMLAVQLKITGLGSFTCYFQKRSMKPELIKYFQLQKEIDYVESDFKKYFPQERKNPIIDDISRENEEKKVDEL